MNSKIKNQLAEIRKTAQNLNYEEAMIALDNILSELQSESVPIAELQSKYIYGQIYIERCEELLTDVEQNIVDLDLTTQQIQKQE